MRVRVTQAFDSLRQSREGQTVAIVTHGGVIRILIAWALRIPDHCLFRLGQDYAAMNLLSIVGEFPSVELLNGRAPECGPAQRRG
jgi:alpha-ribazole phosphatase